MAQQPPSHPSGADEKGTRGMLPREPLQPLGPTEAKPQNRPGEQSRKAQNQNPRPHPLCAVLFKPNTQES